MMGHLCFDLFDPGLDSSPDLNTVDGAGHNEMDVEWMNEWKTFLLCVYIWTVKRYLSLR